MTPRWVDSATSGPVMETTRKAGTSVTTGASRPRKMNNSRIRMKRADSPSIRFPAEPDLACESTVAAASPAR